MLENKLITHDPDILSGIPIFVGTRVPVQTLLDYLEGGHPLKEFLDDFPTVQRTHAQGVLRFLKQILLLGTYEDIA
ncbi:MAG: DUF433 domain-containing protein [Gammaproteobacteria bacterium]|nr:MAG: DUF433 domain-containing protein [Gammaproteobacteria bacterium]RKZ43574.1 MAG: DUF433 domain-containing protein [Gammaproteobacteria bacterium]RKZ73010.1 MAG: DUF433 domain-containing protein [Gammaproteobacteria bacterium]